MPTPEHESHDNRGVSVDAIGRDAIHAARAARQRPWFTALAVVTLALGIGVNAATVTVAYDVLVRPLPYADSSRLVILDLLFADGGELGYSFEALQKWLPRLQTVSDSAAYYRREVTVRSWARSTVIPAAFVTEHFFDVLGARPDSGRAHVRADDTEVIVSRRYADQLLGRSGAIGSTISVSDSGHVIDGVMPRDFAFPDDDIGVWVPSRALVPGTSQLNGGYSKIRRIARSLDSTIPIPEVQPLNDAVAQSIASRRMRALPAIAFSALAVTVAFVGTLAALSTLITERWRDLAVRAAVGASPGHLVGIIVKQGLVLTAAGVAIGLGVALGVARGLSSLLYRVSPYDLPTFGGAALVIGGGAMIMTRLAARAIDRSDCRVETGLNQEIPDC